MTDIYAVSDLHVDYKENQTWVANLSTRDYQDALLLVAGDLTHDERLLSKTLEQLQQRFARVAFVPGNHDLWLKSADRETCADKYARLRDRLKQDGIVQEPLLFGDTFVVPLLSWYDYSFGEPERRLRLAWMDFHRCRWPDNWSMDQVTDHFDALNATMPPPSAAHPVITFSHFMPRADLLPRQAVEHFGFLLPILGSTRLDQQIRRLSSDLHIYGHSHVNVNKVVDGVRYINNARGYPSEPRFATRQLMKLPPVKAASR